MKLSHRISQKSLPGFLLHLCLLASVAVSSAQQTTTTYPEVCRQHAPPAIIKGNKIFVESTGEYLPIKGINYYPRPNAGNLTLGNSQDYYTEQFRASWERDIEHFKALNINAIRLYAVDPGLNHDAFMCALKAAGIYVIVGLAADCKDCAVQWQDPPQCYPITLKQRGEFIIQQFAKYENVLGFSAGNEVSLSAASYLGNLPCQKKFLRDMRAFVQECISTHSMRHIPVGIIFADHERAVKAQYYNCLSSPDPLEVAEFLGINAYLHCDGTATNIDQLIGYKTLLQGFESLGLTVPVMWTEFGCLNESFETVGDYQAQRNFLQVEALFSPAYRQVFNGGFVFEYSTELVYSQEFSPYPFTNFGTGNYGVGYFSPENCNAQDVPCEYIPFPQFQNLANRYAAVDTTDEISMDLYTPTNTNSNPPVCPPNVPPLSAFTWPTDTNDAVSSRAAGLQCPVVVPVYCLGVPGECVTVPLPGLEPTTPAPTTASAVGTITSTPTFAPSLRTSSASPTTGAPTIMGSTLSAPTTTTAASPSTTNSSTSPEPTSAATTKVTTTTSTPSLRPGTTGSPTFVPTTKTTTAPTTASPTMAPATTTTTASPVTETPTTGMPTTLVPTMEATNTLATTLAPSAVTTTNFLNITAMPTEVPTGPPVPAGTEAVPFTPVGATDGTEDLATTSAAGRMMKVGISFLSLAIAMGFL